MIAVVPSGPGVFGFAPFVSSRVAAARSPRSAASSRVFSAANAINDVAVRRAARTRKRRTLDLREDAATVPELLDRDVVPVEQRHEQIGEARVLRILQVLTALDLAVGVTEDRRRQR